MASRKWHERERRRVEFDRESVIDLGQNLLLRRLRVVSGVDERDDTRELALNPLDSGPQYTLTTAASVAASQLIRKQAPKAEFATSYQ